MAKIFFGCSMMGGYHEVTQDDLRHIVDTIESLGHKLISRHQTSPTFITDESKFTKQEIHDRDYEWLIAAEICVFEISNPSLGAGGEISDAVHLGKPILCLYKKDLQHHVSSYILGKSGSKFIRTPFECHSYTNLEEIKNILQKFVANNTLKMQSETKKLPPIQIGKSHESKEKRK